MGRYPSLFEHPTFLTIKEVFSKHKIDAVIVEGIAPWEGKMPNRLFKHIKECDAMGYKVNCGESWFTISFAQEKNADIFSGEPTEAEVMAGITGAGYSMDDLLGFYVVRQIPSWKREGEFKEKPIRQLVESSLINFQRSFGVQVPFGFSEFSKWYHAHMKVPDDFSAIEVDDTAPISTADATYIQKISSLVDVIRDRSAVNRVSKTLGEHSSVLIVYGGSHLLMESPALENMLGKPKYEKLY